MRTKKPEGPIEAFLEAIRDARRRAASDEADRQRLIADLFDLRRADSDLLDVRKRRAR